MFYADGHVRVYHGDLTELPRHYVARERLCLRATSDYWVNAMDGQPFFYVNKEVDPGLIATLRQDLVPFLESNAPVAPELRRRMEENPWQHRFTLVLTRGEDAKAILSGDKATCAAAPVVWEAYSPELFAEMRTSGLPF